MRRLAAIGSALCSLASNSHLFASSATWNNPTGGSWSIGANWIGGTGAMGANNGGASTDIASFSNLPGPLAISLDLNNCSIRSLQFTGSAIGAITINSQSPGNQFTINSTFSTDTTMFLDAQAGDVTINAGLALSGNDQGNWLINGARTLTLNGALTGVASTRGFTKSGGGTLILAGANTFSGQLILNEGNIKFDYTSNNSNKIASAGSITLGGGNLSLSAGANAVAQSIATIGLTAGSGGSELRLAATTGSAILTANSFTRNANTSLLIAGDNLGSTAQVKFLATPALSGSGSAGTGTVGIMAGVFGDSSSAGSGSGLVTYDSTTGVRLLTGSEYVTNSTATGANVRVTSAASTGAVSINSLFLTGGNTLTQTSGTTLSIPSGTVLSSGGNNTIAGSGTGGGGATINFGTNGFAIDSASDTTITSSLTGTGGLIKSGPGTLMLNPLTSTGVAAANAFSTNVMINGGTLAVTNTTQTLSSVFGSTANFVLSNNATLRWDANPATSTRTFALNGVGGRLDFTGTSIQASSAAAQFTGSGALTLIGGSLTLGSGTSASPTPTQPNSYTGGTNLNGGTLILNAGDTQLLGTGPLNLNGGTLIPKIASRTVPNAVSINADTTFAIATAGDAFGFIFSSPTKLSGSHALASTMGGSVQFNGVISDASTNSALTLGGGTFRFAGVNTIAGGLIVNQGTLIVSSGASLGAASQTVALNQTGANASNIQLLTGAQTIGGLSGAVSGTAGATLTLTGVNTILTDNQSSDSTFAPIITGTGGLTKGLGGALTLTGNNNHTGATVVNGGRLIAGANNALGTNAAGTAVSPGAALGFVNDINYTTTEAVSIFGDGVGGAGAIENISGANSFAGAVTMSADSSIGASAGQLILNGAIGGAFNLNKVGGGTIVLVNAANSFGTTGKSITISAGALSFAVDGNIGNANNTITIGNGVLSYTGTGATITRAIALASSSSAAIEVTSPTASLVLNSASPISGSSASFTKRGAGTLVLQSPGSYTGMTTVASGALKLLAGDDRLPTGTSLVLGAGNKSGLLDLNDRSQTIAGLGTAGTGAANQIINGGVGAASVLSINIASGSSNFSGRLGGGNSGNGFGLSKTGTSTLVLSGLDTYTGSTMVIAGALIVNGSHTNGGDYLIGADGTIGGSGTIGLAAGKRFNIAGEIGGAGGGDLSINTAGGGFTDLMGGGSDLWTIRNLTGTPGTDWDLLRLSDVAVDASADEPFIIRVNSLIATPTVFHPGFEERFTIATSSTGSFTEAMLGGLAVDPGNFAGFPDGHFHLEVSGGGVNLDLVYSPEPGACVVGIGAMMGLMRRRARKCGVRIA